MDGTPIDVTVTITFPSWEETFKETQEDLEYELGLLMVGLEVDATVTIAAAPSPRAAGEGAASEEQGP